MLTNTDILRYIERELGFMFNDLEMKPDDIIKTVIDYSLPTFSKFHPKQERLVISQDDLVDDFNNIYYLDAENPIVNVNRIIGINNAMTQMTGYMGNVSPYAGFLAGNPIDRQMISDLMGMNMNPATYRFHHPNKVEILSSGMVGQINLLVVLNTYHDEHFGSIPNNMRDYFLKLALYDVQISLYAMRSRFQNMQTTFGELNLNLDDLSQAREKRDELVERMEKSSILNSNRKKIFFG